VFYSSHHCLVLSLCGVDVVKLQLLIRAVGQNSDKLKNGCILRCGVTSPMFQLMLRQTCCTFSRPC